MPVDYLSKLTAMHRKKMLCTALIASFDLFQVDLCKIQMENKTLQILPKTIKIGTWPDEMKMADHNFLQTIINRVF